ncbi:MAG: bifunctional methylenetetrahydrofolate dehydrogenase/methenyltetrahydrofolate cyclohydrolase [Candidatus Nanopelagicaceae bacterium]|nr:bifunctional methylenetetrahydrofolate dehydrogenase/methenyltetrahydrofolate cyclohydrolase [Candidatus Nanopelagicaceae bacterium]
MATTAKILDGRKLAADIKAKIASQVKSEKLNLGLGTILVGSDPSSHSYVAGKHRDCAEVGINSIRVELPESASESEILQAVAKLNSDPNCTGFIVQLPLPNGVNANRVLESIDPTKDADGLHPLNLGKLVLQQKAPLPCTPQAIHELVSQNGISWEGKNVVVLGRGTTVGRPLGLLLSGKGANATVTLTHSKTADLISHLSRAEIVIAALGKPHFLKREMVREGAVVIDVGLSRIGEKLVGDVDPSVYERVSAYSPVPGGVGPLTRAMLLRNVVELARKGVH